MAWITTPEAWSAAAAILAIALSQMPPVRLWFKRARVTIVARSQAALRATVNGPVLQLYLGIENTGGRKVRVERLTLSLNRDKAPLLSVDAQGYFETFNATAAVMFHPFDLAPDAAWNHTASFFPLQSRDDERAFRREKSALRMHIQQQLLQKPEGDKTLAVGSPEVVNPLEARFDRNFIWNQGEYELKLCVWGADGRTLAEESYRMVLFESDREDLMAGRQGILTGEGVMYESKEAPILLIPLSR